tara:strand:+ start:947 stop:2194 length:1248 start_codon:yes stop_codon:yes gene_type:complete
MAVKFSQFNVGASASDIDYIVGYKSTDNVQIPIGLVTANTTYAVSTAQDGANESLILTGTGPASTDVITLTAGNDITLTDDGAGNGFTIASTASGDTYTIGTSTNGSGVDVNLDAAAGADSNITLTPATGISIVQTAGVVTLTNTAPGDTYTLQAGAKSGTSVPLNLDAATGSDSVVNLTEGTGITLTQTSATEITIESAGGSVIYVDSFTGNGSTLTFTASQTIDNENDTQVFIDGVNQSKSTYSTSGTSLIFSTAPPLNSNIELNNISSVSLVSVPDGVITTAKFSSGTLVTESEGIANNDNDITIPTSAAVKDYVDTATSNIGVSVISSNTTAAKGNLYVLTANLTLTLPASPTAGDSIKISNRSGVATCIVARNGSNIMGAATDLTLDNAAASFELIYSDATNGWVIIGPQ